MFNQMGVWLAQPPSKMMKMERYFIVSNIKWDTEFDGEEQIVEDLPGEIGVTADEDDVEEWEANEMDQDEINYYILDYLTDDFGWCIAGSEIKEVPKEEYDAFIQSTSK